MFVTIWNLSVFSVGPNRYPYNPLGNNAANGILVGPGGPTGQYGRPFGYEQGLYGSRPPYGGSFPIGGGGGQNPGGIGFGGRPFGYDQTIPFNSKAGAGILADDEPDNRSKKEDLKKSN